VVGARGGPSNIIVAGVAAVHPGEEIWGVGVGGWGRLGRLDAAGDSR
jgi:hypothetical protein